VWELAARHAELLCSVPGVMMTVNGKKALNMVSSNFLGVAGDPRIQVRFHLLHEHQHRLKPLSWIGRPRLNRGLSCPLHRHEQSIYIIIIEVEKYILERLPAYLQCLLSVSLAKVSGRSLKKL